jgi:tetrahydromethanopterin S-methyltransferase subunit G
MKLDFAGVHARLDNIGRRLDRVERRLELVDEPAS